MWYFFDTLFQSLMNWWYQTSPEIRGVYAGVIGGFASGLLMFLITDIWWKTWQEKATRHHERLQTQLEKIYAPLYQFYRYEYTKFDAWKRNKAPNTIRARGPLISRDGEIQKIQQVVANSQGLFPPNLLKLWSEYEIAEPQEERQERQKRFITTLVKTYHDCRRQLRLDYDKNEYLCGEYSISN